MKILKAKKNCYVSLRIYPLGRPVQGQIFVGGLFSDFYAHSCTSLAHLIWTVVFGTSQKRCLKNTKLHILLISNARESGIQTQFKI